MLPQASGNDAPKRAEKSYLASAVDSINPWATSRSSTPTPKDPEPKPAPPSGPKVADHSSNPLYGKSFKRYPPDCPPLKVQWFYAADVPKRKPQFLKSKNSVQQKQGEKTAPQPKKYVAFLTGDSDAIEASYQRRLEELEADRDHNTTRNTVGKKRPRAVSAEDLPHTSIDEAGRSRNCGHTRVAVNEDFLFDVDIDAQELAPIYWLGPTYDVCRGTWFYQEGSTLRHCEDNLAAQLEEGYLKIQPWQYPVPAHSTPVSSHDVTPKSSGDSLTAAAGTMGNAATATATGAASTAPNSDTSAPIKTTQHQPQNYRLFGAYMNSVVTYQDATTAWLSSGSMLSWVTSTVYEKFAGGGYMGGIKLIRGYSEPSKKASNPKEEKPRPATPPGTASSSSESMDEKMKKALKVRSAPPPGSGSKDDPINIGSSPNPLTRQLSHMLERVEDTGDAEEEVIRQREEKEIENDYKARLGETQGRDIEHLVLVTHGIGQLLSLRMESINFVHDVNVLRKTLKSVYSNSADLRALNGVTGDAGPGNCRVQVLPVMWRHLLDFPKRKQRKGERDLVDPVKEDDEYPSLEDITIEGVAFTRSLISDLALDVLLYQSAYREHIVEIVLTEANRIYSLYKERNPDFKGKVHIMGHSLGSAIMFDILCRQKEKRKSAGELNRKSPMRFWPASHDRYEPREPKEMAFDFDVEDFYCLGSPIGLFQMLKGRTIAARHLPNSMPSESPFNPDLMDDPFLSAPYPDHDQKRASPVTGLPFSVSSPKASQIFNIFHPSDPISYRMEPLISPAMSSLKPQSLPYTRKGIFGAVAPQGLTGIGAKVGQSFSGLWSSLSAGIASSLLNRSLGLSQEDVARMQQQHQSQHHAHSPGAGTSITGGGAISLEQPLTDAQRSERTAERQKQLAETGAGGGGATGAIGATAGPATVSGNEMTLLDDELETLFDRFQKGRREMVAAAARELEMGKKNGGGGGGGGEDDIAGSSAHATLTAEHQKWLEEEQKAHRLRREEMKVRALNRNGRVDYSIQEGVLDFNPMSTIASHLAYWSDEDVSHFIMSQLLSNKSRTVAK